MKKKIHNIFTYICFASLTLALVFIWNWFADGVPFLKPIPTEAQTLSAPCTTTTPIMTSEPTTALFSEDFSVTGKVEETGSLGASKDSDWWVSSGGRMIESNGTGKTVQGNLPTTDPWYAPYRKYSYADTDGGVHPQNIFRLVQSGSYQNYTQEAKVKINKINLSDSSNRAGSNGILFFNRYKDSNNLYYTGIRVDGKAVIKKKLNGVYYTLAYTPVFSGAYNRTSNPNLLPVTQWMGMKTTVTTNPNGSVTLKVYVDSKNTGSWVLAAEAIDTSPGALANAGATGIRTDFMDAEFDEYRVYAK